MLIMRELDRPSLKSSSCSSRIGQMLRSGNQIVNVVQGETKTRYLITKTKENKTLAG
jgi:hypothetical protein